MLPGRVIRTVEVTGRRSVRRQEVPEFVASLAGRRFGEVGRHGKFLVLTLDDGADDALVVHLRMSGQMRLAPPREERAKHTHVVVDIGAGEELRFVDPRTFGEMFVDPVDDAGRPEALRAMGPDAIDPRLSATVLRDRITAGRRSLGLKAALLDQRVLAGVGNIYADEALFSARLRPDRPAASLASVEAGVLHRSLRRILRAAIGARGSTSRDAAYVDTSGRPGSYAARHQVYGRTELPCPRCGAPIKRIVVAARGTHFCPSCQM